MHLLLSNAIHGTDVYFDSLLETLLQHLHHHSFTLLSLYLDFFNPFAASFAIDRYAALTVQHTVMKGFKPCITCNKTLHLATEVRGSRDFRICFCTYCMHNCSHWKHGYAKIRVRCEDIE